MGCSGHLLGSSEHVNVKVLALGIDNLVAQHGLLVEAGRLQKLDLLGTLAVGISLDLLTRWQLYRGQQLTGGWIEVRVHEEIE